MKKIIFIISIISLFTTQVLNAQDNHKDRWEKIRTEKISFLTDKLDLTPTEAQKFWPVYNELENKRWEAQKKRHDLEVKVQEAEESLSNKEIIQLTREYAGNMQKEGDLLIKYNEEFLKILPPQKVLKLYKAENEFRMYMIKKYRDRRKSEEGTK
ncbi:MAG TPA: hypothetical protein VKA38_15890 [Draconibacterium sp.]|nr:hypothetical protein [Draconibacterium sp.]